MRRDALSGVDAAWLHMERPTNRMVIAGFFQLASHVTRAALAELFASRLFRFPRFMQRVADAGGTHAPRWETDTTFDIDRHVVGSSLPPPGGDEGLRAIIAALASDPLPRDRPLWQVTVFEDHPDGTVVFVRLHHCMADGFALMHVLLSLCEPASAKAVTVPSHGGSPPLAHATTAHRTQLRRLAHEAGDYARPVARLLAIPPDRTPPFHGPLTIEKRVAWTRPIPLALVKSIGRATGTTLNDVLTATVAGALRTHMRCAGHSVGQSIRAMVPVNLRTPVESEQLGNRFGLVVPELPIQIAQPLDRLAAVHREMEFLKGSREAVVGMAIVHAMGLLPRVLEAAGVSYFAHKTSLVLTNVPGPREPLTLAGGIVRRMMFWVPQSGSLGLGISILSYAGDVTIGVFADALRVPDAGRLARDIEAEFEQLARDAGGAS